MAKDKVRKRGGRKVKLSDEGKVDKLNDLAAEYLSRKAITASASAAEAEAKADFEKEFTKSGKKEYILPMQGERPATVFKWATRVSAKIDAEGFRKLVSPKVFATCVSLIGKEAVKHATQTQLDKITTKTTGNPFLDVRTQSKK